MAPVKQKRKPAKPKLKYDCQACGELFATITEHMTHFVQTHPEYTRSSPKKLWRKVTCWQCVGEIPRGEDGRYRCECGFLMPRKDPEGGWLPEDAPDPGN